MGEVIPLPELAEMARDLDSQRAAGQISAADHARLLSDIEQILNKRGLTWAQLVAATATPASPQRPLPGQLLIGDDPA